jgi:UDP-N-acetylmuramoyl-tripeptide--D-alanyl-D-alanine ligase
LDQLGTYQREIFNGKVIGLTGSNGKTTTKEIIFSLLEKEGCHKTKGNKNNHIGVPLTLASLTNMQKYAVIEIGTNSPGEINKLSAKVTPDIALIINAAASHLEKLDSVEKVAKEKSYILRHLKNDGVAVLPRDSEFFSYWKEKCVNKRIISFGFHQNSDIWLRNVQSDFLKNKISFELNYAHKSIKCFMNGIGVHNSLNACAALAVCHALEMDLEEISINLSKVTYPSRRMEVHKGLKGSVLVDDSYNANPESMKKSLDVMKELEGKKRIFIAGEMRELGEHQDFYHGEICKYTKGRVEEFLCIGKLWEEGIKDIPNVGRSFSCKDELLDYLNTKVTKDSIILVKGSRSTGMDYIADKLKL